MGARLGAGTFGVVFAARQPLLGRQVALKVLRSDHAASAELKGRFRTEATVLAELDHPHIVKVFEYHEVNDLCVLVMERLDGGDLRGRLGRAPIDVPTACTVALAACSALQQAHLQSVLHRDIKPANLMFSAAGILKITDFGIAKVLAGMQPGTVMDSFLGTPSYVAPEQVSGDALGPGVDIYAVATLLYELLSGQLPHPAGGGPMAVAFRHVTDPPRPLGEVAPELPTALIEAVMRGLARSPADRYESAEAFGIAIARAAAELGPRWHTRARVSLAAPGPILEELLAPSPAPSPDQAGQTAIWSRASSPTDPAADPALAGSTELWPTPTIPIAQLPAPEPAPEPAPPALPVAEPEPAPPAVPIAQPPAAAPAAVPPAASPPVAPPPARRRTLIAGLAALVAVAAGGTIYALTGSSDKNTASVISSGGTTTSPTSNSSGSPDFANVLSSEGSGVLRVISDSCSTGHSGTGFLIAPNLVATASSLLTDTVSVSVSTAD
ncbi:MAG: serine/threonine-protein kinase, partial [Jatrophihabitantaceae bacterium]